MTQKHENDISYLVRKAAYIIHIALGPGLLESVYETLLCYELRKLGLHVQTQVALPVIYDGLRLENSFRIDLLVEYKVVIELKSVEVLLAAHHMQLLTYLKLSATNWACLLTSMCPTSKVAFSAK